MLFDRGETCRDLVIRIVRYLIELRAVSTCSENIKVFDESIAVRCLLR